MTTTFLTRLALTNFRSYRWLELLPGPGSVLLLGPNGAGKTNILEAISLLGPGRGLRRADLGELRQLGTDTNWGVAATLQHGSAQHQLATGKEGGETEKRIAQIDGTPSPLTGLAEFLPLSWLVPEMDRILGGDRSERRKFYDRLVTTFDPAHSGRLARYDKLARERLALLLGPTSDDTWLATLENDMAQSAVAIAAARLALAEAVNTRAPEIAGQFPVLRLSFADGPESWLQSESATAVEERLRQAYHGSRARDRRAETTGDGPARSDLVATYVARRMPADLCSTGEQKALLITLLMTHAALIAQARRQTPILLLDEVASHLDPQRRQALFATLHSLGCQLWMTGTERQLFSGFPGVLTTYDIIPGRALVSAKKTLS